MGQVLIAGIYTVAIVLLVAMLVRSHLDRRHMKRRLAQCEVSDIDPAELARWAEWMRNPDEQERKAA